MGARFTAKAERTLKGALRSAREMGHTYIGTEHILLGLLSSGDSVAATVLTDGGVSFEAASTLIRRAAGSGEESAVSPSDMTPCAKRVIETASVEADRTGAYIGTEHILYALVSERDCFGCRVIASSGASVAAIKSEISIYVGASDGKDGRRSRGEIAGCPATSKYGRDLVDAASKNTADPLIGREAECERVMQILCRRTKNNPCLVGEPGVGKTAIVEGLAAMIAEGNVPENLKCRRIVMLDISSMIAGAKYRGEFEERMKSVMEEVRRNNRIILFIDEIHTIIGAGSAEGALDAANILKPALSRGEIQLIGATTLEEYRRHIEKDAALERRFQSVTVREPSAAESVNILRGLRDRYEAHHKIKIGDDAIGAAVDLSVRFIKDRYLPDKAIDLVDESASRVRMKRGAAPPEAVRLERMIRDAAAGKKEALLSEDYGAALRAKEEQERLIAEYKRCTEGVAVSGAVLTAADVAETLTNRTGIPLSALTLKEETALLGLEDELKRSVVGQDAALKTVAAAVRRGRIGIKDPDRPSAVFLFAGPSGVGKTETAKALSRALSGSDRELIRFDMSEFTESHSISKLIGSPPGYVGYEDAPRLTEAVRRRPYGVVLFDEIEKAHRDVCNLLLQIMEDGRLTDATGRECDFGNTVIIMTSNVGGNVSPVCLGFSADDEYACEKNSAKDELKNAFSPEFIGRIDEIVLFGKLTEADLSAIAEKYLSKTVSRLSALGVDAKFAPSVASRLVAEANSGKYGARPLRRLVVTKIDDALADAVISGEVKSGDRITVTFDGELKIEKAEPATPVPRT